MQVKLEKALKDLELPTKGKLNRIELSELLEKVISISSGGELHIGGGLISWFENVIIVSNGETRIEIDY